MNKLSYRFFKSAEDFEKWQEESPLHQISQVSPFLLSMEGTQDIVNTELEANMGVFVLYWKEQQGKE